MTYHTRFGSLRQYQKGGVEAINDDPRNYAFANIFEVANNAEKWERVAVARNLKYAVEVLRAEGTSPWYACAHDEAALVMDGEVAIRLVKPDTKIVAEEHEGATLLEGAPSGRAMGHIKARRGHMALLPKGSAYQFHSDGIAVILIQTIAGDLTIERWAEICQH
ncbi:MAG TPA: hypothetical protein VHY56_08350 [Candidatus Binataceae bacterium]|nr:hypothetical protein [Candidatus Binataceae bacterium]